MNIDKKKLLMLWAENKDGLKKPREHGERLIKSEYKYWHSMFPTVLTHNVSENISEDTVFNCKHPKEYIEKTYGWADNIEGRECSLCGGSQTKSINYNKPNWWPKYIFFPKIKKPWGKKWIVHGRRHLISFELGWNEDLVLAIAKTNDYTLSQAILIAATSCERCMNSLAHKYGLTWGYPEYSDEWKEAKTSCEFCK